MTFLVERLAELRKHLDHLDELRPRISAAALRRDPPAASKDTLGRVTPQVAAPAYPTTSSTRPASNARRSRTSSASRNVCS